MSHCGRTSLYFQIISGEYFGFLQRMLSIVGVRNEGVLSVVGLMNA